MMFPFPAVGHFDFDARLLPVQSIDDAKDESSDDCEPEAAKRECRGRAATDDEARNRNLVWRDSRFAKKRDDCRFDRRVNVSRQVERSVLGGIENDPLRQAAVLLRRRWKTDRPHTPTHVDDVIILLGCVDDIDLAVVDLFFKFLKKARTRRKRRKKIFHNQRWSTRISD